MMYRTIALFTLEIKLVSAILDYVCHIHLPKRYVRWVISENLPHSTGSCPPQGREVVKVAHWSYQLHFCNWCSRYEDTDTLLEM